jgi:hypothetical protein
MSVRNSFIYRCECREGDGEEISAERDCSLLHLKHRKGVVLLGKFQSVVNGVKENK